MKTTKHDCMNYNLIKMKKCKCFQQETHAFHSSVLEDHKFLIILYFENDRNFNVHDSFIT